MRKEIPLSAAFAVLLLLGCGRESANMNISSAPSQNSAKQNVNKPPKDGDYPARGKVTRINHELGSIELDHEEIKGVMAPMIMEFYVDDRSKLKNLKVGDDVDFVLRLRGHTETIGDITKRQ
jgi:Cu/Ag efflux protein CusF